MAIPEKPESRAEMYLNKIASGSGTIPAQPESRLEQYLDVIANNGGGGGSGGGGVEFVNVTFVSSAYAYGVYPNVAVAGGVTYAGSKILVEVDNPVTVGFPKFGSGPVKISLRMLDDLDQSVMPQVSGEATLDLGFGELVISGDCTFTAAGINSV